MASVTLITLVLAFVPAIINAHGHNGAIHKEATVVLNINKTVAQTDPNFICATIDWWPKDKCDHNNCPWGLASLINLNLSHPILSNALQAFKPLRLRLGGSLQDQVLYRIGKINRCDQFNKQKDGLFGFSTGCLHMERWDELNNLFKKTGVIVTFGINALYGRHKTEKSVWVGNWDSSNAYDFINYTVSKGYPVDSWEFGNELSGKGIGASVGVKQYADDVKRLKTIINDLYKNINQKPPILAPGGFYEEEWYSKFIQLSGPNVVNVLTHHIYNLGEGVERHLDKRILDPHHLNKISHTFRSLQQTIENKGSWASAWVGEAGGAFNSGGPNLSDTYINSFWYLDQLGMAAEYNTKVYCRQALIGGNYALLDTTTFIPNPDFYSALLWHRLMGEQVLHVKSNNPYLRTYAHHTKGRSGITLLLINLSDNTEFQVRLLIEMKTSTSNNFIRGLKDSMPWAEKGHKPQREEYHLTPKDKNLRSKTMLLNGNPLDLTATGEIPNMPPAQIDMDSAIKISPLSIKFIVFSNYGAPTCSKSFFLYLPFLLIFVCKMIL